MPGLSLAMSAQLPWSPAESPEQTPRPEESKDRDRSRTIGDIMKYVYQWRDIAENGINGVKVNLQEAALYTGVPKKSLDDYYYQLRVGEKYNFDFELNRDKNISVLRKFVKVNMPKRSKPRTTQPKLSKNSSNSEQL